MRLSGIFSALWFCLAFLLCNPGTAPSSPAGVCGTCQGSGTSSFACSFCRGTGKNGSLKCSLCNGRMFTPCSSCGGTGRAPAAPLPASPSPGTGQNAAPARQTCSLCNGSGTSNFVCNFCRGTGKNSGFKCTFCDGKMFSKCTGCAGTGYR